MLNCANSTVSFVTQYSSGASQLSLVCKTGMCHHGNHVWAHLWFWKGAKVCPVFVWFPRISCQNVCQLFNLYPFFVLFCLFLQLRDNPFEIKHSKCKSTDFWLGFKGFHKNAKFPELRGFLSAETFRFWKVISLSGVVCCGGYQNVELISMFMHEYISSYKWAPKVWTYESMRSWTGGVKVHQRSSLKVSKSLELSFSDITKSLRLSWITWGPLCSDEMNVAVWCTDAAAYLITISAVGVVVFSMHLRRTTFISWIL